MTDTGSAGDTGAGADEPAIDRHPDPSSGEATDAENDAAADASADDAADAEAGDAADASAADRVMTPSKGDARAERKAEGQAARKAKAEAGAERKAAKKAQPPRGRRPWTLQRKLIVTVVGITSFIMVLVAVATSVILGTVLETQLDAQLEALKSRSFAARPFILAGQSAEQILQEQPQPPGTLLAVSAGRQDPTAAVVTSDADVVALTAAQIDELAEGLRGHGPLVVTIDGMGSFRIEAYQMDQATVVVVGVSRAQVAATLTQMLTTIALLTIGGLLLLAAATAWTIRAGLVPLRSVADTAARVSKLQLDQGEVKIAERVPAREADPRTEVGRVGEALNALLDHVDESLVARQRNEQRMRRFVADASHELRTPLASIRGYSELSMRALSQSHDALTLETTEASLDRIQAQSLRMTTLVEDLLLLARLDEGQELIYGSVDLSRLAIEAVGDARPAGPDHNWVIDVGEEPVVIAGDTGRLNQVAANLLANARTHTPAGTTVTVTVLAEGADAVIRVHDDGPGIDPVISAELFERFSRADRSRARQTGGTGLGLSIVRAIVEAHSGSITVHSEPGDTTFEVRLPKRPDNPA